MKHENKAKDEFDSFLEHLNKNKMDLSILYNNLEKLKALEKSIPKAITSNQEKGEFTIEFLLISFRDTVYSEIFK